MPKALSPAAVAKITGSFLEKANRLNLKNYDNDVRVIKGWAAEARETLRRVDITRPDLDAKTLAGMKALAAGKQEDERIVGLAFMAHKSARTGGQLAAEAALFAHLSGPSGFVLAHEPDSAWDQLPADVRSAAADWADKMFGNDLTRDGIRDAVRSLKTEKIAGVVAYIVSGRMHGDVAHWESLDPEQGGGVSLAEHIRDSIGLACADAVLKAGERIVDGKRAIAAEINGGDPSSNDRVVAPDRPDRLVITPSGKGGVESLTMALAFSGAGSSDPYFGDFVEAVDALAAPHSNTPFAGALVNWVCVHAGDFIASGQPSGSGVDIANALEGASLQERQDLAMLPLLSTPLQWKSKKRFMDFFRFNPLVLGTSTLRWSHFVEGLADSTGAPERKRRDALLWTIDRFANGLKALDAATNPASHLDAGIEQHANATLEKATLLLRSLPGLGGDVLTKKDYDDVVMPFARQVSDLVSKLNENIAGRSVESVLDLAYEVAFEYLRENSFPAFKEKHANQLPKQPYESTVTSCVVQ